jgi:hypothetical protein
VLRHAPRQVPAASPGHACRHCKRCVNRSERAIPVISSIPRRVRRPASPNPVKSLF